MKLFRKPSKWETVIWIIGIVGMIFCNRMVVYTHKIHDATEFTVEAMQEALYGSQIAGIFQILGALIAIAMIISLWVLRNKKQ